MLPCWFRSWKCRPGLMVSQWWRPHRPCAPRSWWPGPSNKSPCWEASAPPTSTSRAPPPTCHRPPRWTWTTAPYPSTRSIQTLEILTAPPNRPTRRTAACRQSPRTRRCWPPGPRTTPTAAAAAAPALAWTRRRTAVSVDGWFSSLNVETWRTRSRL